MSTAKKSKAVLKSNNTTGYHGVTRQGKYFIPQIYHHGKTHRLGKFTKAVDAAMVYDGAATEVFGDRAKLNFPAKKAPETQ